MSAANFAGRLKELRQRAGLTQAELANRAGLTVFGVAQLEQARRKPVWDTVLSLAKALGVSCETFEQPAKVAQEPKVGRPRKAPAGDAAPRRRKAKGE